MSTYLQIIPILFLCYTSRALYSTIILVYTLTTRARSLEGRFSDAELQAILEELTQKRSFDF